MDRHRVHILVCDHNSSSGPETLRLLRKCFYQVTAVKSARQALDVLNSSRSADIDLILSEVDLPHENGCKVLKYVMGQERLRRIPVVVTSERDEMALVAKCLRLGAVDYLVKPLRSNEVMNLWTHMWRRRRVLGIPDKHTDPNRSSPGFPVESLGSDSNGSNISDTTRLTSDERDNRTTHWPAPAILSQSEMPPHLELSLRLSSNHYADSSTEQVGYSSPKKSPEYPRDLESTAQSPKDSEHDENRSSAFVSYTRINIPSSEQSAIVGSNSNADDKLSDEADMENDLVRPRLRCVSVSLASDEAVASEERAELQMGNSSLTEKQIGAADIKPSPADVISTAISCGGQVPVMPSYQQSYQGYFVNCSSPVTDAQRGGFINQSLQSPSLQLYHYEGLPALPTAALPPSHTYPMSNPFSFYSLSPISSPQFVPFPTWHGVASATPVVDCKIQQAGRREAALNKFRLKRKDRCFEKKIRYASRKKLAEQRPRVKGQFVRRITAVEKEVREGLYEEEEEEEEEE